MSTSPRPRPPSLTSTPSLHHTTSTRSNRPIPPAALVITAPPWAKDEPPSPKDHSSIHESQLATDSRPSDVASYQSSNPASPSRWWTFTLPRPRDALAVYDPSSTLAPPKTEKRSLNFKDRSMSWRPREGSSFPKRPGEKTIDSEPTRPRDWNLSITLPTPPVQQSFTIAHNATPGWETPWTARVDAQGPRDRHDDQESLYGLEEDAPSLNVSEKDLTPWKRRKKRFRAFILSNPHVPLLFRIINITFTAAALGVAVRIRRWEASVSAMGAVGSSPTLVIIFAPLTLTHVMAAIYLEYFGRPLGLWRTSGKLFHTLSEVVFICAWSAALSLCFDNYFTSLVPCASWSTISWYNELPRPPSNIPSFEGSIGDTLCDAQLALICLVGVGLLMYCTNLIISLFRIFEKVKYHPAGRL